MNRAWAPPSTPPRRSAIEARASLPMPSRPHDILTGSSFRCSPSGMRRLLLLGLLALPLPVACKFPSKASDAGSDAAPSASASASDTPTDAAPQDAASASSSAHVVLHAGLPIAGGACNSSTDTRACSPDHGEELTCTGGVWHAMTACRGPSGCKGSGASVMCEVGTLISGDPCFPGNPPAHCVNPHSIQQCSGGKWTESVCMPPSSCKPNGNGTQAACK
jgi:hypothetical protein